MNAETIAALCEINNKFYKEQCASFSQTRNYPWPGWRRCLETFRVEGLPAALLERNTLSVLDLACGNLRFESFVSAELSAADVLFCVIDNCNELVPMQHEVHYQSLDVLAALQQRDLGAGRGAVLNELLDAPACDVCVSFGFMHHVPSVRYRQEVLAGLVEKTCPGGYVAVSFWQFLNDEALGVKAELVHERALGELQLPALDEGDYLLGWKNVPGAYRYCHNFSEEEIDHLAESVADRASVVARFNADGRTGDLNSYLVLKVHEGESLEVERL